MKVGAKFFYHLLLNYETVFPRKSVIRVVRRTYPIDIKENVLMIIKMQFVAETSRWGVKVN